MSSISLDFFTLSTFRGGLYFNDFLQLRKHGNLSRPFFNLAKNSKKSTTAVNMFLIALTKMHLLKSITRNLLVLVLASAFTRYGLSQRHQSR